MFYLLPFAGFYPLPSNVCLISSFPEQLGARLELESQNNPKLLKDAQLCYICSGNFDKLVTSWSGDATKSTNDLQELVELVSFLQRAMERQGRQVQAKTFRVHGEGRCESMSFPDL
ncbi:hypothetical protein NQ318_009111 [Aromia moschata]|uniref:Uncharacterized protein n=1 Tax=Aromia moschata TaxID=1265417 RepID=A0AAV8XQ44_9CUCU|nr:hypothetical protein NQ318_009111 [Aromia moschata]